MSPIFSIIIPSCGRPETLKRCLSALSADKQGFDIQDFEIIVSDDGFSEVTEKEVVILQPNLKYIKGPGRGPASNRNRAALEAEGRFLVFTDDDCVPEPGLVTSYLKASKKHPDIKVFEGRIFVDRPQDGLDETSPINETGGRLWSCNFAIEREYFESLKGFDERFPFAAMEDVELQKRIFDSGNKIHFVPEAAVCHPWRKKQVKDFKNHEFSTLLYLEIQPSERSRINGRYYLYLVTYGLVKFVFPKLIRGKFRGLTMQLLEYSYFLKMALKLAFRKQHAA